MVKCLMCQKEFNSNLNFQQSYYQSDFYLSDSQNSKPAMVIKNSNTHRYDVLCSEKCAFAHILAMGNIRKHILEKFGLIFTETQINQGIIEQLVSLKNLIEQEINHTTNVYLKQTNSHKIEELRKKISLQIKSNVDDIITEFIQHLQEAIWFSKSETEKINSIKEYVEKLINEQGKINLLNHKGYISLCEEDIQKYRIDEMNQLMDKLMLAKKHISSILSENNEQEQQK